MRWRRIALCALIVGGCSAPGRSIVVSAGPSAPSGVPSTDVAEGPTTPTAASPVIESDCPGGSVAVGAPPDTPEFLAVVRAVHRDPDNFGEIYVEPNGTVVIQYVGDNAGRSRVEEKVPDDMEVRWQQVRYSRTELGRIQDEIVARRIDGVYWTGSGNACNAVTVGVDEDSLNEIRRLLADEFGDAVHVLASELPIAW